jgi:hypothetical protein
MNRSELRDKVTKRLGIPPAGDGLLDTAALNDCIQLALTDIAEEQQWPWLLTSAALTFTAGIAPFPTSPAVAHIRELTIDSRRAKRANSLGEFLDALADGNRCVWFDVGTNVQLAPVPAAAPTAARLYYTRNEPTLANDAATPLLPEQYHNVIVARAAYHGNMRRSLFERAAQDLGEYREAIKKMADASPMRTGPRAVRSVGSTLWAVWA